MKKRLSRLSLNRETLLRLDDPTLRKLPALGYSPIDPESPLCGPTYWESCECQAR
jgi:hypothetical protein